MPTENKPAEPFQREDRYIVIKRSDMDKLPADVRRNFSGRCRKFYEQMLIAGAPARSFLVVESDWPEYEPAWKMIERRMTGQPAVTAAEELEAVLHWRNKHAIAVRERDALQQRLNAADQRIDELTNPQCSEAVCRGDVALGTACGICARCEALKFAASARTNRDEVKFKGMIETVCGTFAVMIDEANAHYGWTFLRHPDGMWVSGRKATDAEMQAARRQAQTSQFLTGVHPYSTPL